MTLPQLSASKLKLFTVCPRQFWYAYIEKLDGGPRHPAAALGSAVHSTIEQVYKQHADPVMTFLRTLPIELEDASPPSSRDLTRYTNDGIKMVADFPYHQYAPEYENIEYEFLLRFPNDAHAVCEIKGIIDHKYEWGFLDLKTNGRKPLQGVLDNNLQFILYHWAFERIHGYKPERSVWYHLRTQEELLADVDGKLDDAARVVDRILEARVQDRYDKHVGDPCGLCPYRAPCLGRDD